MKKLYNKLFFLVILFIVSSCNLDNFDFNKLSEDLNISPEFVIPLASADISLWDIIKSANNENDTLIKEGDNKVLKIVYTKEGIYKYEVREFLDLPTEKNLVTESKIGNITLDQVSTSKGISIADLQSKLTGAIQNIVSGESLIPDVSYTNIDLVYDGSSIDMFDNVTIASANLTITLSNKGFVFGNAISIGGQIFDKNNNNVLANFLIEDVAENSKSYTTSLNNESISNNLGFRLTTFEITSSGIKEDVDLNSNLFELETSFENLEVSSGDVKIESQTIVNTGSFDFAFADDAKIFEAKLEKGYIKVDSKNQSNITGKVTLSFPDIKKDGVALESFVFNIGDDDETKNLNSATIDLTADTQNLFNTVNYNCSIVINATSESVHFDANDFVQIEVQLSELDFQSISGDFGEKDISIPPGSFDMDLELFDKIEGNFILANPVINLLIVNSIGIPASASTSLTAKNKNGTESVTIERKDVVLETRDQSTNSPAVTQTIQFNKDDSPNIVSFIALPPSGSIDYQGSVKFNPGGAVSKSNANFFNVDDSLKIDVGVDLPFELKVKNLSFSDTTKVNKDDFDMIKSAELTLDAVNQIPLEIDLEIMFIDTTKSGSHIGDIITSKLLASGTKNSPVTSQNKIILSEAGVSDLKKANAIVFKGIINSPNSGEDVATLYSDSNLKLNVVLKSKFDL